MHTYISFASVRSLLVVRHYTKLPFWQDVLFCSILAILVGVFIPPFPVISLRLLPDEREGLGISGSEYKGYKDEKRLSFCMIILEITYLKMGRQYWSRKFTFSRTILSFPFWSSSYVEVNFYR